MILSNTASQARQILDNVRRELMENLLIRQDFPELFGPNGKLLRLKEEEIITHNKIRIVALGSGQQVRGRRFGAARPTLVIADDLENADTNFSSEVRLKAKNWYEKSVLPVGSESTNFIFLGNCYDPFSLLGEYIDQEKSPIWMSRVYSAIAAWPTSPLWIFWRNLYYFRETFEGISGPGAARKFYEANRQEMGTGAVLLWPERYDLCKLMEKWAENEIVFMSEYQNTPLDPATMPFHLDDYAYWTDIYRSVEELLCALGDNAEFFMGVDPSMADSVLKGDFSAIVVLVRDKRDKTVYCIVADIERCKPHELVNKVVAYYKRFKCIKIGIEANNFQGLLVSDIQKKAKETSLYPNLVPITNTTNKVQRILEVQPALQTRGLLLSRSHAILLEQLKYFPKARHDDGPDALRMALQQCEETTNQFSFGFAGGAVKYNVDLWTGRVLTQEEELKIAQAESADGLVRYGHFRGRR